MNWDKIATLRDSCVCLIQANSGSGFTSLTSCIFLIWLSKYLGSLKVFPQAKQQNIFIWRWVFMCALQFPLNAKCFSQRSHLNGFWPLWILRCALRSPTEKNALLHSGQVIFLSPVCLLLWALRLLADTNFCPQVWHSNGFSFVWTLMCPVNSDLLWKDFSHSVHLCFFSFLSHSVHIQGTIACRDSIASFALQAICLFTVALQFCPGKELQRALVTFKLVMARSLFFVSLQVITFCKNVSTVAARIYVGLLLFHLLLHFLVPWHNCSLPSQGWKRLNSSFLWRFCSTFTLFKWCADGL